MSTSPTITMRSAGDLVAVLPYLLGYQPRDSLVLVCLSHGRVCLTACQPLPPSGEPPRALDALLAGMAKADPEAVIVLGYENTRPQTEAVRHAALACTEVGVRVHDQIIVTPDGWQSVDAGAGSGDLTTSSTAVAELVGAGVAPRWPPGMPGRGRAAEWPRSQRGAAHRPLHRPGGASLSNCWAALPEECGITCVRSCLVRAPSGEGA
jgi:hypothetical protein